jgi:mRNA deadenylase 3'-5' endonuclease subunit Ccr4
VVDSLETGMPLLVASYNVLADSYINPAWYPGVAPALLARGARTPAIVRRIAELDSDVVCLQEVEPGVAAALSSWLEPLGYFGHYAPKGGVKPDGCATFVRTRSAAVRTVQTLAYRDGGGRRPASGHIALVLVLEWEALALAVANTHLKWDPPGTPPADRWGLRQITQLLEAREDLAPGCAAWIICGDFNAGPDSDVLRVLEEAGFASDYRDREHRATCVANGKAKMIDFLCYSGPLTAQPIDLAAIDDRTALPSEHEPSDHLPVMASFRPA